jgi:hypothetical protein
MNLRRASWRVALIAALALLGGGAPKVSAQWGPAPRVSPLELLGIFVERCAAMNVDRDTGAPVFYVYAYATIGRRHQPLKGDNRLIYSKLEVCIFDREDYLSRAQKEYRALQAAFRQHGGASKYRDFPFEDRSWRFGDFPSAREKAFLLRRTSWMSHWPEVLNLRVEKNTGKASYFLFGYRPIHLQVRIDRDEEDGDTTFVATKGAWRLVIFDDEEVAQAARRLYQQRVKSCATLTDGMGHQVGQINPHLERTDTYAQARRRADQLRRQLLGLAAPP